MRSCFGKIFKIIVPMAIVLFTLPSLGGVGAGNEFKHFVNYEFDFHIGLPQGWECIDCEPTAPMKAGLESDLTWKLEAPESSTWLEVTFITGFPAVTETELRTEIGTRHSGWQWYNIHRADDAFVGYSNSVQLDDANTAVEYYLVKKNMVIRLAWQKNPAYPNHALQLDLIKKSIDRVSSPLKIKSIKSESMRPLRPGERACWTAEVDDLRSKFSDASVENFEVKGTPSHFSFKSIRWVPEKNWFQICQIVPTAAGADGLKIASIEISDDVERGVFCKGDSDELSCHYTSSDTSSPRESYVIRPTVTTVDNPSPDSSGPILNSLTLDTSKQELQINATDETGLYMGSVMTNSGTKILYPDQLTSSAPISLTEIAQPGWNTITQVILYDKNGLPTLLTAPEDLQVKSRKSQVFYTITGWNGQQSQSNIPVIAWLKDRR